GVQLFHRPRQITHDKPAPDSPKFFALRQPANILVAQPLRHDAAGRWRDVYADPLPVQPLGRHQRRAATAEGVEHDVVRVTARPHDSVKKGEGFLRWVAKPLSGL